MRVHDIARTHRPRDNSERVRPTQGGAPLTRSAELISRQALFASVSALALMFGGSQAAIALPLNGGAVVSPVTSAVATATVGSQQAAAIAQQAQSALSRAAQAVQAMQALQSAARTAAQASASAVPNGLSPGGLVVDPRVTAGTDATLWQNISSPTQTTSNGQTTVTLTQTAQRAIATWEQFNVGKNTTVDFDQSAGDSANGNSWIVLNRIDATGSPSQILGSIKADGTVLIINPNGIVFTGTSQINVHTLIASSNDINSYSNTGAANVGVFATGATGGIYVPVTVGGSALVSPNGAAVLAPPNEDSANQSFVKSGLYLNGAVSGGGGSLILSTGVIPNQTNQGVVVQPGASISTDVSGFDNGGAVALLGPSVVNNGSITTAAGQIILAAGSNLSLTQPTNGTALSLAAPTNSSPLVYAAPGVSGGAVATNDFDGLLSSSRGNITLVGDLVNQLGVAEATTSITRAGSITIIANQQLTFGGDSVTSILPDENGETIPQNSNSTFAPPSIAINAGNMDMQGAASGQAGALILAPGAAMTVATTSPYNGGTAQITPVGRVLLESGSVIDLAGLDATASVANYLYTFKVTANDVADSPPAQSLIGKTVTIDLRLSGVRADGLSWVGSPLFSATGAGYLGDVPQTIDQRLTQGGSLTFASASSSDDQPFQDVLQQAGSVINVSGGRLSFTGGVVKTTTLAGSDGRLYDIANANPFIGYLGFGGSFTVNHRHWDITETWTDPLVGGGYYQPGYVDGVSAGSLSVTAGNPVLEGSILSAAFVGTQQAALAESGTGANAAQVTPDQLPRDAALSIALVTPNFALAADAIVLQSAAADVLGPDFTMGSTLNLPTAAVVTGTGGATTPIPQLTISTDNLSADGFSSISITGASALSMAKGAALAVQAGGGVKLSGVTTIDGALIAHAGAITLTGYTGGTAIFDAPPTSQVTIGPDALLDVSGLWVNDAGADSATVQGAAHINGGSITIQTYLESSGSQAAAVDTTQSIMLAAGSVIDVSSGGYVQPNGKLKTASDGLPAGVGGNLSLLTYISNPGNHNAGWADPLANYQSSPPGNVAPGGGGEPNQANVILDGAIYSGGLAQGGAFTLQAPTIQIGGVSTLTSYASGARAGELALPSSFFASNGFSTYALTSVYGGVTVTAGATVLLQQKNDLLPANTALPASGASLRDFATLGLAETGLRQPANLTLTQLPYIYGGPNDVSANAGILVDAGAAIVGEPGAAITLTAAGPVTVLGGVTAHGGGITLTNDGTAGSNQLLFTQAPPDVWIGPNAALDVSGVFVPNPLVAAYQTGAVLAGGAITLSGGAIVAMPGSSFDLAGAGATVQVANPAAGLNSPRTIARPIWSDGGALTLVGSSAPDASAYFDGTVNAAGGAAQASGGTLTIGNRADAYGAIVLTQSGAVTGALDATALAGGAYPTTSAQLAALLPTTNSTVFITADTLSHSGFDSALLMASTIAFSGNVAASVPNTLILAGNITLLPAGVIAPTYASASIGGTMVNLDAGYVLLASNALLDPKSSPPSLSDGALNINGSAQIDLAGYASISNAANVKLTSGGDIRLLSETDSTFSNGVFGSGYFGGLIGFLDQETSQSVIQSPGMLLVPDNLTLTAREVYPTTDSAFLLMSTGKGSGPGVINTIAIASNGRAPAAPLSADGEIVIDAPTIVQSGALMAPLGAIQLGFDAGQTLPSVWTHFSQDLFAPSAVVTQSLTLAAGSLTSVTAAGLDIPYGTTVDGSAWSAIASSIVPYSGDVSYPAMTAPPAKSIALNGADVDTQAGATLDLRGGGDIYATEFVAGTGGSRNVLTGAGSGQTVYALVPSYQASVAANDPIYGAVVAAGTAVTLPGGDGVAAGTYTLLPAIYATLPGAYRVVVLSTDAVPRAANTVMPDGSIYMTGALGDAITGARSSQTALLEIQSKAVWTKYSEIDIASGNSYFAKLAAAKGVVTPLLPIDAGQLVVGAANALTLQATNLFAPASGGRGGQVDITGADLLVLAPDQTEPAAAAAGYIVLDSDQISNLGAESVLIGGTRTQKSDGTWITPTAASVVVDTDVAHPLSAPDLLLAANPTVSDSVTYLQVFEPNDLGFGTGGVVAIPVVAAGSGKVTVLPGSVVEAKGAVSSSGSTVLRLGSNAALPAKLKEVDLLKFNHGNYDPTNTYYLLDNANPITAFYEQAYSGGGLAALLEVSNGPAATVERGVQTIPATITIPDGGRNESSFTVTPPALPAVASIAVGAGAVVAGGKALTLNGGDVTLDAAAKISGNNFALAASTINFGVAPANASGLTLTPAIIAQLAGAQSVILTSASVFNSYDASGVSLGDPAHPIGTLTLDGGGLYSAGGATAIVADNVVLTDSQATPNLAGALAATGGTLTIDATANSTGSLALGAGAKTLGFATIDLNASQQIVFSGSGSLDAGSAAVTLAAPAVVADAGSVQSLTTKGLLTLAQGAGATPTLSPSDIGGALTLTGGGVADSGVIIARAGKVTLTATAGDIVLDPGAGIVASGSHIVLFDETLDAPGGAVKLTASAGDVAIASGAAIDVSATGNGYAGSLAIQTATTGVATLNGMLLGGAAYKDLGGDFTLNAGSLGAGSRLPTSFTGSIAVSLQQGDLLIGTDSGSLASALSAGQITLTANGGGIVISGSGDAADPSRRLTILDASGRDGQIALYGANGVTIKSGVELTAAYVADDPHDPNYANGTSLLVQNGGSITLGVSGAPNGGVNATYGYENVDSSGAINVASNAAFDVSGGPGGANISNTGGAIVIRAPILTSGNVNVSFGGTAITAANGGPSGTGVVLDAYAVWSTTDSITGATSTDGGGTLGSATHFDGIIDPAGWYNADGSQISGSTTNGDIFTPNPGAANQNHIGFYQTTLVGFVQNGLNASAIANDFKGAVGVSLGSTLHLRPEIDLINPTPAAGPTSVNGGNITVASNWNLGAGSFTGPGGAYAPVYRTVGGGDPGEPGVLALMAANNVQINATVSDGFYETADPFFVISVPFWYGTLADAEKTYAQFSADSGGWITASGQSGMPGWGVAAPVTSFPADWNSYDQGLWYKGVYEPYLNSLAGGPFQSPAAKFLLVGASGQPFDNNPADYPSFTAYLNAYNSAYVGTNYVAGEPASITGFIDDPTAAVYGGSYQNYVNAYRRYINNLIDFDQNFYQQNPGQMVNLPPTAEAPMPPPAYGASYETSAAQYVEDYQSYAGYFTYFTPADPNTAFFNSGMYTKYLTLFNYNGEPGGYSSYSSQVSSPISLYLVAAPYLPTPTNMPNFNINVTAPAAGPGNAIANNPAANGAFIDYNTTTAASLMPLSVSGQGSFSYNIVAGAQFTASGNLSANPAAVITAPAGTVTTGATPSDSVTLNGHSSYADPNTVFDPDTYSYISYQIDVPTVLRTGVGSIAIAAAGSVEWLDATAPGAIYTAGAAANNAPGFTTTPALPLSVSLVYSPTGLITNPAWGAGGGGVTIVAGADIVGIETPVDADGSQSGVAGLPTGEFWSAWYYVDGASSGEASTPFDPFAGGVQNSAWINYGTFFQGVGALGGGNVTLKAGGDIDDISASLPETIQVSGGVSAASPATAHDFGGGDLIVQAGGNLYSSTFYVGRGAGSIEVGGAVAADPLNPVTGTPTALTAISYTGGGNNGAVLGATAPLPLLLAEQDGFIAVSAGQSLALGDIFEPTRIPFDTARLGDDLGSLSLALPAGVGAAFDSYGASSGVALTSVAGDVTLKALQSTVQLGSVYTDSLFIKLNRAGGVSTGGTRTIYGIGGYEDSGLQPTTLDATALTGNIFLDDSMYLYPSATGSITLSAGLSYSSLAAPQQTQPYLNQLTMLDDTTASTGAVYLFDLLGGATPSTLPAALHANDPAPAIVYAGGDITGGFNFIKPAKIEAGDDIVDTNLVGQNNNSGDITSVIAGRDIVAQQTTDLQGTSYDSATTFQLYGPGSFLIQAGRNLGPFFTGKSLSGAGGVETVGDGSNLGGAAVRSYLPVQGANLTALFGVGSGVDYQAAIADYVDPAAAGTGGIDFLTYIATALGETPSQAWLTFETLPTTQQRLLVDRAFLDFIAQVGLDYNNPASAYYNQYARAYDAIATLFPASLGYTNNAATGANGAAATIATGDLSMAHSLLETQTGGDIALIGPGGNIFVGANATDNSSPNQEGVLTLQGGSILTYTDQSVIVDQSRIFTEQGGDVDMFSANGNLNAGKGPKSSAAYPPLTLIWDVDGYTRVNPAGLVTGAGIGALLSVPGQDPSLSNVDLVAPRGTVDAGAAGIRVAGNLNIAALFVVNAFNIQVGGASVGVPTAPSADVGALTTGNNAAGAAAKSAEAPTQPQNADQPSIIMVEILGFGGASGDAPPAQQPDDKRRRNGAPQTYNQNGNVQVLGFSTLTDSEMTDLTEAEKQAIRN